MWLISLFVVCVDSATPNDAILHNEDVGYRIGKVKSYKKLK